MSTTIDPTKNKILTALPPSAPPPKTESKKPAVDLDAQPSSAKIDVAAFYAANAKPLAGAGVSSAVFGNVTPSPRAMTNAALGKNLEAMSNAMKASPGKVNDHDLRLYGAMVRESVLRQAALLDDNRPVGKMSNGEVMQALIAYDVAKASGMSLTKQQEARFAELETTWKDRSKFDMGKEVAYLKGLRADLHDKMRLHCFAAAAGAGSLVTHNPIPSLAASAMVLHHAIHDGNYFEAGVEVTLTVAARIPATHYAAEITSIALNTIECAAASNALSKNDKLIKYYEAELAKKAAK